MGNPFLKMDPAVARAIRSKGGEAQGRHCNPSNFSNDRAKARRAGAKGSAVRWAAYYARKAGAQ